MLRKIQLLETEQLESESEDYSTSNFWRLCREADERQAKQRQPDHERRTDVAQSTLDASAWLFFQLKDQERWEQWLDQHSAEERASILEHIKDIERRRQQQ